MHLILVITGTRQPLSNVERQSAWAAISRAIGEHANERVSHGDRSIPLGFFVGDCPTGIDRWLTEILGAIGQVKPRIFCADRITHGKAAGPIRNREMIDAAVDLATNGALVKVLAFPKGKSPGTRNCIGLARKAGLDVSVTELEEKQ